MKTISKIITSPDSKSVILFLLISSIILSFHFDLDGQSDRKRPTIGLVLSGGGARGIAHIGVLKVMEEAGLRPDYITGVSMGSIIGGMYSAGYSADSLYKILLNMKWKLVLSNNIPENKVIFLEKSQFNNSILSLPLSSGKVTLPSGIISGQQFENILSFYLYPAAAINDFSKLPIPFLCLGTDIINYRKADLKSGYLPDAIRASSSVPSVFTPLKIDSMLLLDGGLIRNFAAEEVKKMGADIVIGSYVGFYAYDEEKLKSLPAIMEQIAMYRSLDDFNAQKKYVDVLIKPDIKKYSIFEFENVDTLVKKGYESALPFKPYFKKLADSLNNIAPQKPMVKLPGNISYSFDKIEITGNKLYSDYQIRGVLGIEPGQPTDNYTLNDRIELLYGKTWFEKVKYKIIPRNDSLILVIDCIEKPKAMFYGSAFYNNSLDAGLILSTSFKDFIIPKTSYNIKTYVGKYSRLDASAILFIDNNEKYGLSVSLYGEKTVLPMLSYKGDNVDIISRNFNPGLSILRVLGLNQLVKLSLNFENLDLNPLYNAESFLKGLSYNYLSEEVNYSLNTLNTKHFPDKGTVINFSAITSRLVDAKEKTAFGKIDYDNKHNGNFSFDRSYTLYANFKKYFSPTEKLTFKIESNALYINDSDSITANNNFYTLGGTESLNRRSVRMTGFNSNEIAVKRMAGLSGEIDFEAFSNFHFSIMADIFAIREANRKEGYSLLSGTGAGIGYMTVVGPMKIGIMNGNYKEEKFFRKTKGFISLGFLF